MTPSGRRKSLFPTNCQIPPLVFGSAAKALYMQKIVRVRGVFMRKSYVMTGAIVTAIALSFSGTAFADPLAPGKPAGVHAAQMGDKEWLVFGGIAVVAAVIAVASAGGGNNTAPQQSITASIPTTS
jgi:hypothetical protein